MIVELARGPLATLHGNWTLIVFWDGTREALALLFGDVKGKKALPCRVHSSCITAHVFLSTECDCREQMAISMAFIAEQGAGVVIWLDHEGRANGMMAHVASQILKRDGLSQSAAYEHLGYPRDSRIYFPAAEILRQLEIDSITVLTNNPDKIQALREAASYLAELRNPNPEFEGGAAS